MEIQMIDFLFRKEGTQMSNRKRAFLKLFPVITVVLLLTAFTAIYSGVTQSITVDGSNDFLPANLVDLDGGDTEFAPLDIDTVYVTNDANKLYIGFYYDKDGWTNNQLGIVIADTDTAGGTTDAWGHAIAWNNAPHKPDYQAYCNMDNSWQELREWGGSSWDLVYSGTSSLGWVNNTGFEEVGFNLSDLGASAGDTLFIELISTQDGSTKGPLDCMANDDDQLSTTGGTTWDVAQPVELDSMLTYVIVATGDTDPPVVDYFKHKGEAIDDLSADVLEVGFNEPVDETTAENTGNYTLTGTSASIDSARVNSSFPSRVSLYLDSGITPQNSFYQVKVTGVEDLAANTIVDNDTTNVACFFYKGLLFRGRMKMHLRTHSFPTDTFTVEGSLDPLTFAGCDNAFMTDKGDSVYEVLVGFSVLGEGCHTGSPAADTTLEWKFMHQCTEYEPLASNRQHLLSHAEESYDTLDFWWNDEDPTLFTDHQIDVVFSVDMNNFSPGPDSVVAINGSELPLSFAVPSVNEMKDDGVAPDASAGDGIYTLAVRFPAGTFKDVGYKFLYNDVYECQSQGNRDVYLNDAAYDTLGGTMGALEMPLAYYDRCGVIGRDVEVVFKVNLGYYDPDAGDTISLNGTPNNQTPQVINWDIPSINQMRNDGVYPDETAGDDCYAISIVFPDSSDKYVEYKYLFNSVYECTTQANRYFYIDDSYDAAGNPQVLEMDHYNACQPTDDGMEMPANSFTLKQNYPNPFNPSTRISFSVPEAGRAVLRIYNVRGQLVRTLLDRRVEAGEMTVSWNGKDQNGRAVSSGVYFCNLRTSGMKATRKMVLLR
ncbi:MAG: T9SS type A sorting domain-containing protein [Candidatus Latescibacteria bacterium]|nr:T9SS type A sorting domain-containing protein [bacterium]MBD3423428.1 T9SS type A sorting domain-containing protein [Candidatus Latescibacterota bacterium]